MGIFVHPLRLYAARLFATVQDRRHVLVCELDAQSPSPNALIVPLPAAAGPSAIDKVDPAELAVGWDGRRSFFDDLTWHFVAPPTGRPGGGQAFMPPPNAAHAVSGGWPEELPSRLYPSFETTLDAVEVFASAASLTSLERALAPRPALHELLRQRYPEHALAVCPFPEGLVRVFVAVRYAPRDASRLFYPLLQVTDGEAATARATYQHELFGQGVQLDERMLPFDLRDLPPLAPVAPPPFPSFVRAAAAIDVAYRKGPLQNEDLLAPVTPS